MKNNGFNLTKMLFILLGLLAAIPLEVQAQANSQTKVSGMVTDQSGIPLAGVTVRLKDQENVGAVTDFDGNYQIDVPNIEDATLIFSFVGFVTKEVPLENRSAVNVTLQEDVEGLSEVVVIGYGSVKKTDLTGSVSSLDAEELNPETNTSIDQLLSGRAAGVQVNQASSEPGGGVKIRIRGASSINAGNEPLYVIDGLPISNEPMLTGTGRGITNNPANRNPINSLNPSDIESIEILKDASATAIYGSRGANGVIMITTKRGKEGRTNVDYSFTGGMQEAMKQLDILNAPEYVRVLNELRADEGREPEFSTEEIAAFGAGTNWQEQILRTAYSQNHNFSVYGGDTNTRYNASLSYLTQEGIVISSGLERYVAKVNLEQDVSSKFKFGINLISSKVKDDYVPFGNSFNAGAGVIGTALQMDPTYPVYDENGMLFQTTDVDFENPVIIAEEILSERETNRTFGNVFAEYLLIPELALRLNLGSDRETGRRDAYNPTTTKGGLSLGGVASIFTSEHESKLLEATASYNKQFKRSNLNTVVGYSYQQDVYRGFDGNIAGFPSDATLTDNLNLGDTEDDNLGSYKNNNTLISYFGRVNYTIHDKYLLTGSIRADGSSRFGENNKFGYFPSFAAGWRLSEEEFIKNLGTFNNLKLRASWGISGNQAIGNYNSLRTFSSGSTAVFNDVLVQGVAPDRFPNPDLKWEATEQLNIGLDAGFFNGRLSITVDYFVKTTEDLIFSLPIPGTSGFQSILQNVGSVGNKGFEFLLDYRNYDSKNFSWDTSLNFSAIQNEVLDLGPQTDIISGNLPFTQGVSILQVGAPLNSYYGHEVTGIFQEGDDIANSAQPNAQPGYPIFRDVNGDSQISDEDKVILGDPFPDFTFGLSNTFRYKRIQFDFLITGEKGAEMLNQNLLESIYPIDFRRNRLSEPYLERWTPNNPTNEWPSGINPSSYGGSKVNSLVIEDASFIKLKNIKLSYEVNTDRIDFVRRINIFTSIQNVLFLTDYRGFDPEVNVFGGSNLTADYNAYPAARTYSLGLNMSF